MIYTGLGRVGEIADVKANGGADVAEVYGGIGESNPIFYSRKTLTGTSPLTFKGLGQPLKDYHVFGETLQDGTPSPDYPVDVQGVGERTVNLWDGYLEIGGLNGGTGEEYNPDRHYYVRTNYLPLVKSDYPTVCVKANGVYIRNIFMYNENKIKIATVSGGYFDDGSGCVFSLLNACRYIRMYFQSDDKPRGTAENNLPEINVDNVNQLMINDGNTPTEYEPPGYKIPVTVGNVTTPIYIGSDPLYRVGEYADEIRSDGTVVRKVIEQTLMGYGDPGGWSSWGNSRWAYVPPRDVPKIVNDDSAISNYYRKGTENQQYFQWYNYIGQMIGFFKDTRFNTITEFRDYVKSLYDSGNPLKIYYILETPTTEQVTVPSIPTIVGDNTLTVDTTVKPSAVSITGPIKPTGYGQLVDVNGVKILDKDSVPIYVHGQQ